MLESTIVMGALAIALVLTAYFRHKGELYTRIPVSYLKWMVNSNHNRKDIAEAELKRRGTVTPDLEISGHAIDKASLRCLDIWRETRKSDDEGLHAWLVRISGEALAKGIKNEDTCFYKGMKLIFIKDGVWPVLKSIMRF